MSVEINGTYVLIFLLVPFGLLAALVTAPRWCIRGLGKHALWRLRDAIVDDTLDGRLPADHKAVQHLIAMVEWAIHDGRSFDVLHRWIWVRACRGIPEAMQKELEREITLSGLSPTEAQRVKDYRERYLQVAAVAVMISSWMGVLVVMRFAVPRVLDRSLAQPASPPQPAPAREALRLPPLRRIVRQTVVQEATNEAAIKSRIGRQSRAYVEHASRGKQFELSPAFAA